MQSISEWKAAKEKGLMTQFYDNFTKRFIAGFGWSFQYMVEDMPFVEPTPEAWQNIQETTGLDQDEKMRRDEYYRKLREVSALVPEAVNCARANL